MSGHDDAQVEALRAQLAEAQRAIDDLNVEKFRLTSELAYRTGQVEGLIRRLKLCCPGDFVGPASVAAAWDSSQADGREHGRSSASELPEPEGEDSP